MGKMVKEFKEFIAGGNMLELAIGVILGGAIGAVIKAFTENVMMQIVAAIFGKPNFDEVGFRLGSAAQKDGTKGAFIGIGSVITAFISLVMVALVLFMIIKAYNKMKAKQAEAAPAGPSEVDLLTEIRDSLKARN
jgi:large conductance mechanosensitive channel